MEIQVACLGSVVRATVSGGILRRPAAGRLCSAIEEQAQECGERPGLLFDLGALSRATPAAGWYAMGRLRSLPVERIALVGADRLMRGFAGIRTMRTVSVFEAKTHLSRLLQRVAAGEEIVISSHNRPIARLDAIAASGVQPLPIEHSHALQLRQCRRITGIRSTGCSSRGRGRNVWS
ncbi:hypothetical protein BH24CHL8_BH24CHL8_09500 [soil metagenome]